MYLNIERTLLIDEAYALSKRLNELRVKQQRTARETYELNALTNRLVQMTKALKEKDNKLNKK